jgi:hypothetical protein
LFFLFYFTVTLSVCLVVQMILHSIVMDFDITRMWMTLEKSMSCAFFFFFFSSSSSAASSCTILIDYFTQVWWQCAHCRVECEGDYR